MKQILLMIAAVALVGCGKKEPVQPYVDNTEATNPELTIANPEPTKAKTTGGVKLWEFETGDGVYSYSIFFHSGHRTRQRLLKPVPHHGCLTPHFPHA